MLEQAFEDLGFGYLDDPHDRIALAILILVYQLRDAQEGVEKQILQLTNMVRVK
jgi:hypothetical protein